MIIAPSILSCDFLNIETEIKNLESEKDLWVHLDIMDGHFVPNLTFGGPIVKQICSKFNLPMDAHIMVDNPDFHMDMMKDYGLHNITFHFEATDNCEELVEKYRKYFPSIGVSIKPGTEVSALSESLLKKVDLILIMSVEPGFGGQSFMENSLDKIKFLDKFRTDNNTNYLIQVDGGINEKTVGLVKDAGVDNIVAGSFVFKGDSYSEQIKRLR